MTFATVRRRLERLVVRIRNAGWIVSPAIARGAPVRLAYEVTAPNGHSTTVSIGEIHTEALRRKQLAQVDHVDVRLQSAIAVARRHLRTGR